MPARSTRSDIPPGLKLRHSLHTEGELEEFAWSPDGKRFATAHGTVIQIWDTSSGAAMGIPLKHPDGVDELAWSPDGRTIVSYSMDGTLSRWDVRTGKLLWSEEAPGPLGSRIEWSPTGKLFAFTEMGSGNVCIWADDETGRQFLPHGSKALYSLAWLSDEQVVCADADEGNLILWDVTKGEMLREYKTRSQIISLDWSPHHQLLAAGADDGSIEILEPGSGTLRVSLEGHSKTVNEVSFSSDGKLLASKSFDRKVRLWDCETWKPVAILEELKKGPPPSPPVLEFHPSQPILATLGESLNELRLWDVDVDVLRRTGLAPTRRSRKTSAAARAVHYANAKVVLVGDASVGKSGLSLVLTGQPFVPTLSTHGRNVWTLESKEVRNDQERVEIRETLLWDLAGQPGYRLIHQLHLNEIAVALVIFDAQSDTDPLAGVRHWHRALRQAQRIQGASAPPLKKFLVAARVDRGNINISQARIDALVRNLGFDGYFKTSAKEGTQIPELARAIREAIDWEALPRVSSTELFERIKAFLIAEKEAEHLLSTTDEIYRLFLKSKGAPAETPELREQFEMCIGRVEWRGLIRRLSFGGLVLLQPELLDAYASALVIAAKDEPDGLGSIPEEVARAGRFSMPRDERVEEPAQEKLLLIAVVEDLLHHEIALREHADGGPYLTFPSQLTREMPDLQELKGKAAVFKFEGPVLNVYATLVVRLSHSNWFQKKELWKNAAVFNTKAGGTYGIALRELDEGQGELTLFYDEAAGGESRIQFEEYVRSHLQRRALPETITRRRILACASCNEAFSDEQATHRLKLGHSSIRCPVCDAQTSLHGLIEQVPPHIAPRIQEMDKGANERRDTETAVVTLEGKRATRDYDVFLSYNRADKESVLAIAERLKEKGILPWVDVWDCPPGTTWQKALEKQIKTLKAAAVFVGKRGVGPWQNMEVQALLQRLVKRKCTVIPVLLADAPKQPKLPLFLETLNWVDFRRTDPEPVKQLIWGITGERRG